MDILDIKNRGERFIEFDSKHSEFRRIYPFEVHTVINESDDVCELLIIVSESYNPDEPDTYKCEVNG